MDSETIKEMFREFFHIFSINQFPIISQTFSKDDFNRLKIIVDDKKIDGFDMFKPKDFGFHYLLEKIAKIDPISPNQIAPLGTI